MIYVAVLLCDLKIRPIHTAPVTAPLPACLLTENQAIRAKWQFSTHVENRGREKKKKKKKGPIHSEAKVGTFYDM